MNDRASVSSARGTSVRDDWRAWLPEEKYRLFRTYAHDLEVSYYMLSVSLDEALEFRQAGRFNEASQTVCITSELCTRFASPLVALLWSLSEHAKHYGTIPNAAPLDPSNFQGTRAQRVAIFSSLLCKILLSQRLQFLHKLNALSEMVDDLNEDFCAAAAEIASSSFVGDAAWCMVDTAHYDLNTCFREAVVLLKSFLRALPDTELDAFGTTIHAQMRVTKPKKLTFSQRLFRHRRIALISGE